jgi:hypothetical protein
MVLGVSINGSLSFIGERGRGLVSHRHIQSDRCPAQRNWKNSEFEWHDMARIVFGE